MAKNNKNKVTKSQNENKQEAIDSVDDLQIIMQGGEPVSVIVPIAEFDRMVMACDLAQELLEGKDLSMPDGKKVTFTEMVDQRLAAELAAYEAELDAMFAESCDDEDACDDEEDN